MSEVAGTDWSPDSHTAADSRSRKWKPADGGSDPLVPVPHDPDIVSPGLTSIPTTQLFTPESASEKDDRMTYPTKGMKNDSADTLIQYAFHKQKDEYISFNLFFFVLRC